MSNNVKDVLVEFIFNFKYWGTKGCELSPNISTYIYERLDEAVIGKLSNAIEHMDESNDEICNEIYDVMNEYCDNTENIWSSIDFEYTKKSQMINDSKIKILDKLEEENYSYFVDIINAFNEMTNKKIVSPYTSVRLLGYEDWKRAVNSYKNNDFLTEKELCEKLGIVYYNDNDCWVILKQKLLDKGCNLKYLGDFRLRLNAIAAWEELNSNPDVSIEELYDLIEITPID